MNKLSSFYCFQLIPSSSLKPIIKRWCGRNVKEDEDKIRSCAFSVFIQRSRKLRLFYKETLIFFPDPRICYSLHHGWWDGAAVLDGSQGGGEVSSVGSFHHLLVPIHNVQVAVELLPDFLCQLKRKTHKEL